MYIGRPTESSGNGYLEPPSLDDVGNVVVEEEEEEGETGEDEDEANSGSSDNHCRNFDLEGYVDASERGRFDDSELSDNEDPDHREVAPKPQVDLPANWEVKYDDKNGRWFFLDHVNKTTTWEPPTLNAEGSSSTSTRGAKRPGISRSMPEVEDEEVEMDDAPDAICCPITQDIMIDPVLLVGDGHTYERDAISTWLYDHDTSPLTNQVLPDLMLVPNHAVKKMVAEWHDRKI